MRKKSYTGRIPFLDCVPLARTEYVIIVVIIWFVRSAIPSGNINFTSCRVQATLQVIQSRDGGRDGMFNILNWIAERWCSSTIFLCVTKMYRWVDVDDDDTLKISQVEVVHLTWVVFAKRVKYIIILSVHHSNMKEREKAAEKIETSKIVRWSNCMYSDAQSMFAHHLINSCNTVCNKIRVSTFFSCENNKNKEQDVACGYLAFIK